MAVTLAVESSCDETAVAVVSDCGEILAEGTLSQIETHQKYGGVVPEVASRAHFEALDDLAVRVLAQSKISKIEFVSATCGPGLIGPLLVGASWARGFAAGLEVPFRGVHHLRGHIASVLLSLTDNRLLSEKAADVFPACVVLASGGHTQVLIVDSQLRAQKLADTADDAAGECFDKSAKLMGLPYPGGPQIEQRATLMTSEQRQQSQILSRELPRPKSQAGFSFSGLKTAIRLKLESDPSLKTNPAMCGAIQQTIAETLAAGIERALSQTDVSQLKNLVFCGGVAANQELRKAIQVVAERHRLTAIFPPLRLATDNAAMIAAAAFVQAPTFHLSSVEARISLELS
jgi:N6-L-threonylcarbamoyladenine synthase